MRRTLSEIRRRRAVAVLMFAAAVVAALLVMFGVELANTQAKSERDLKARLHDRAVLAAALMDSLFGTVQQQERAVDAQRVGTRVVSPRVLDTMRQSNTYVALVDPSGRVLSASRGFTAEARRDLARSAALALVRSGRPYGLGNVLPYGHVGVINFAVAFQTRYGERFLLTGFSPRALTPFLTTELRKIPVSSGSHNYVIDANRTVLASTNHAIGAGYRFTSPQQVAALSRLAGTYNGRYYDQASLTNSTWRIMLVAPQGPLFASVSGWRKWLPWVVLAALAIVAAAALALGARVLRSAESELRATNARLAALNEELERANAVLAHDALHDSLTGLANRSLFMDRVEQILQGSVGHRSGGCAVLFVDLDGFKLVNDRHGHAIGDEVLVAVANRFNGVLRPGDMVARIGGDEFALVLDRIGRQEDVTAVADRLLHVLSQPINVGSHSVSVAASVGIAFASPDITGVDLVRNADAAMYHAKYHEKGTYAVFDESMRPRLGTGDHEEQLLS